MSTQRDLYEDVGKRIKREAEAYSQTRRRQMMVSPAGLGGGTLLNTITPCAACKLLRRRCAEECPFSPYFSPHEPHRFAAVHKVFGASNVSKMLMEVPESQRADAANSLVYEANVRLRDPVYGCMGAISALQQQVQTLQAEVNTIRAEILRYKYRQVTAAVSAAAAAGTDHHDEGIIIHTTASHHDHLVSSSGIVPVAIAAPPTPPPQSPPPLPSIVISSSSSSTLSSSMSSSSSVHLYALPTSTTSSGYTGTINPSSCNHVSYFA